MKNYVFLLLLSTTILSCQPQRPSTIDNPAFDTWSGDVLEITKVETTDSATILHIDAFFRAGWWIQIAPDSYIKESGTDEKLLMTKAIGIEPGEKFFMPDSGKTSFKLLFPPLGSEVTKIDFIESDCKTCFKIWGISLIPGTSPITESGTPFPINEENKTIPEPFFSTDTTIISGKIYGFLKEMEPYEITIHYPDPISLSFKESKMVVSEDGSFHGEIPISHPSIVFTDKLGPLFLVPGKEIKIHFDLRKKARFESRYRTDKVPEDSVFVYTSGSSLTPAQIKQVLNQSQSIIDQQTFLSEVVNMDPQTYRDYLLENWHLTKKKIDEKNITPEQKKILTALAQSKYLQNLLNYQGVMKQAYYVTNNIPRKEWRQTKVETEQPDQNYYTFLNEMITSDLAYDINFAYIVNSIPQLPFLRQENSDQTGIAKANYVAKMMDQTLGIKNDFIIDIAKAQTLYKEIQNLHFLAENEKQQLKTFLSNKAISEKLIQENDDLKRVIENNKVASGKGFTIHETPDVSQDKMFDTILAKFKGKTVVVDFWATWCGPCLRAIEAMKPLKEEMKNKEVAFVYLTGETSPTGTWNKMIPDIHGHHFRVSDTQWKYWYKHFEIEGVPTFMIFNKEGEQSARYTGFPGEEAIRKAILGE